MGADDRIRAGGDLAEELLEGEPHGVGQHEGAGEERDAECDRRRGEDEAQLVRQHLSNGGGQHGSGS
jgi:hypothetical protein